MDFPRVLIISHNCFSATGSNGRTLMNFFRDYPEEKLAQFYIYNELPAAECCKNYYRVTDIQVLRSVLHGETGDVINDTEVSSNAPANSSRGRNAIRRTPFVYLIREMLWSVGRWKGKRFTEWLDNFNPDIVLFQAGDAAFLFQFAEEISKKKGIPLIIYNSENYYFKNINYLQNSLFSESWYSLLHLRFRRIAGKAILHAELSIYISDELKELYDVEFHKPSYTIMTSASAFPTNNQIHNQSIVYLGNLGVGRAETLLELAEILKSIDTSLHIDIYGKADLEQQDAFSKAAGIEYKGFVSYEECINLMTSAMLLIHVESFTDFFREDSKYAFSTKVADSLASGTCLFVYAPADISITKYLKRTHAAPVATTKKEAYEILKELIINQDVRSKYAERGLVVSQENHSLEKNRIKFQSILNIVAKKEGHK